MKFTNILASANKSRQIYDVVVVGGGIIGCATARQLKLDRPELRVALVEKENSLAKHQTGHNSGVLHAGIYYTPGSIKAKLCVQGIDMLYDYMDEKKIPYKKCGKLIVALDESEIDRLEALYERAKTNACREIRLVDAKGIAELEPHCRGNKAIWSPHTGITDFANVTRHYADDFKACGGEIFMNWPLTAIESADGKTVKLSKDKNETLLSKYVITCAGLQSDRIAQLTRCSSLPKIVPFRGEYLFLKKEKSHLVKSNIYPVPDPRFPFLGVHFSPTIGGDVLLGPNAVLAFKREGYGWGDISLKDLYDALAFRGMWKLIGKYAGYGLGEIYRGIFISAQVKQLQRYIPELELNDVTRGKAGVRAQAIDSTGSLVDDFVFDSGQGEFAEHLLHVRNAPSPGATSSLAIAKMVVEKAIDKFHI